MKFRRPRPYLNISGSIVYFTVLTIPFEEVKTRDLKNKVNTYKLSLRLKGKDFNIFKWKRKINT